MNKLGNNIASDQINFEPGDIFEDREDGEVFILSKIAGDLACISLKDGQAWNGIHKFTNDAIDGLSFIGKDLKITISNQ